MTLTRGSYRTRLAVEVCVLVVAISGGCAIEPSRIVVDATPADREVLSGRWRGEYHAGAERRGLIMFDLKARGDHADGTVLMIPRGRESYTPAAAITVSERSRLEQGIVPLTVRFVRTRASTVSGAVTPYWDPDRRCDARATFEGRIDIGRIVGTFVSTCTGGGPTISGRWSVVRSTETD